MGINSETRSFHNAVCDLIKESSLPPVNIELVLTLILRDVANMTNEAIRQETEQINQNGLEEEACEIVTDGKS